MGNFKVGDLVTPDADKVVNKTFLYSEIGNTYKIVSIAGESITLDRPIKDIRSGWVAKYWKLAKNKIVLDIIKDL